MNKLIGWVEGTVAGAKDCREMVVFAMKKGKLVTIPITVIGNMGVSTMNDMLNHLETEHGLCKVGNKDSYTDIQYFLNDMELSKEMVDTVYKKILTHTLECTSVADENSFAEQLLETIVNEEEMKKEMKKEKEKMSETKKTVEQDDVEDFVKVLTSIASSAMKEVVEPAVQNMLEKMQEKREKNSTPKKSEDTVATQMKKEVQNKEFDAYIQTVDENSGTYKPIDELNMEIKNYFEDGKGEEKMMNEGNEKQYVGYIFGRQTISDLLDYALLYVKDDKLNFEIHLRSLLNQCEWIDEVVDTHSILKSKCCVKNNRLSFIGSVLDDFDYMEYRFLPCKTTSKEYMEMLVESKGEYETCEELNKKIEEYFGEKKGKEKKQAKKEELNKPKHFIGYTCGMRAKKPCMDYVFFYMDGNVLKTIPSVYNANTKTFYKNQWNTLSKYTSVKDNQLDFGKNITTDEYINVYTYTLDMTVSLDEFMQSIFYENGKISSYTKINEMILEKETEEKIPEAKAEDIDVSSILNKSIVNEEENNPVNKKILLGWIEESEKVRTAIYVDVTTPILYETMSTYTFNIDTLEEETSSVFLDTDNKKMYISPNAEYTYHQVVMETENVGQDICFLENRKLFCTVSLDIFAKGIKVDIKDFGYDALVELLKERNMSAFAVAKEMRLL